MTIGGVNGAGLSGVNNGTAGAAGMNAASDPVSRNIQKQIENYQKKLQDLSSDENLSPEEKIKKRQEIQQEIASLTQQLRQHQMELKREQKQACDTSMEDMHGGGRTKAQSEKNKTGLSQEGMAAVLSAGAAMKQAGVYGSTASKLEGEANVLASEIKMDAGRGSSTEKKQQKLAETEGRSQAAANSQAYSLGNANKAVQEAAKAEKDNNTDNTAEAEKEDDKDKENVSSDNQTAAMQTASLQQQTVYASVDIRL